MTQHFCAFSFLILRQSLTLQSRVALNSLWTPGQDQTHSDSPASSSKAQACTTIPGSSAFDSLTMVIRYFLILFIWNLTSLLYLNIYIFPNLGKFLSYYISEQFFSTLNFFPLTSGQSDSRDICLLNGVPKSSVLSSFFLSVFQQIQIFQDFFFNLDTLSSA